MDFQAIKQISEVGFSIFFGVAVIVFVFKYVPRLVQGFMELSKAIDRNTEITAKQYRDILPIKDELIELKKRLEEHDKHAERLNQDNKEIKQNQEEILQILKEIENIVMKR